MVTYGVGNGIQSLLGSLRNSWPSGTRGIGPPCPTNRLLCDGQRPLEASISICSREWECLANLVAARALHLHIADIGRLRPWPTRCWYHNVKVVSDRMHQSQAFFPDVRVWKHQICLPQVYLIPHKSQRRLNVDNDSYTSGRHFQVAIEPIHDCLVDRRNLGQKLME